MGEATKLTRRGQKTTRARKTVASTSVVADDQPEVESFPPDDSDLARLLNAPEWEVIGALEALASAGQSAVHLARTAKSVTLLVRGKSLQDSM